MTLCRRNPQKQALVILSKVVSTQCIVFYSLWNSLASSFNTKNAFFCS
ncbi:hypothetical protein BN137_1647 [Cronobacter condimenti 1330]|uniref:Uncharacterized protein n=1 Tax=Cronobacter condimenti 1330 TaxID=1073999 RepID=K8ADD6_9ENTR|nr:hypothetical protein BN137_1647 [Cronobacter condimenti 1330]